LAANTVTDRHHSYKHLKEYLDQRFKERKCKVYLLHGEMTDEDLAALYQHEKVKALVSLAHGEGFGLPLFEAAYYGLPVVCPDWSGQCDFLYAPTKNKKTGKQTLKPHFARVDYDLQPIQKEAEWAGVLHPGSMWCYPKKNSYKSRLRDIYKDHKRHLSRSKKLRKYLIKEFVPEKMYDKFVNAMHIEFEEKQEQSRVLVL
jgi:glycosyltransferase involved in cell wall biosynthesis